MPFSQEQQTGLSAALTRKQQGTANETDLRNLDFAQSQGWKPPAASPAPGAVDGQDKPATVVPGDTTSPAPVVPMDASGAYKASDLGAFFQNDFENKKKYAELLQEKAKPAVDTLNQDTPDFEAKYNQLRNSSIQPIELERTTYVNQAADLKAQMQALEDNLRNEAGGRAPDWYIQSEAALRAKPLQTKYDSLLTKIQGLDERKAAVEADIGKQVGFAKDTFTTKQSQAKEILAAADKAFDNATNALKEGRALTKEENDRVAQALINNPNLLRSMTKDELKLFQQTGFISYEAIQRMGLTSKEEATKAAAAKATAAASQKNPPQEMIKAQYDVLTSADPTILDDPDRAYQAWQQATERARSLLGLSGTSGSAPTTPGSSTVQGYDLKGYATSTSQAGSVAAKVSEIGKFNSLEDVQNYLDEKAQGSLITAGAISKASEKYGVPWELLVALTEHESNLGLSNVAKLNNNPGGITWNGHNGEKGSARPASEGGYYVKYKTMQDGLDATAEVLSKRKVMTDEQKQLTADYSRQVGTALQSGSVKTREAAQQQVRKLIAAGDIEGANQFVRSSAYNSFIGKEREVFDENNVAIDSFKAAQNLLDSGAVEVGPYKALIESGKPWLGVIAQDPKYAEFNAVVGYGKAKIINALFGATIPEGEKQMAQSFAVFPNDTLPVVKVKLRILPLILQYANDLKVASKTGQKLPHLNDYLGNAQEELNNAKNSKTTNGSSGIEGLNFKM